MKIYQYLARFGWFAVKVLLAVGLLTGGLVLVYQIAMNSANAYVIVTDGLKMRASTILTPYEVDDSLSLSMYFTDTWLAQDSLLQENPYQGAEVTDFVYHLRVEEIWCQPWNGTATLVVEESIPTMDGYLQGTNTDVNGNPVQEALPAWKHARYRVTCKLIGGIWMIDNMEELEELEPEATPTDEPDVTLRPSASPTPTVSAEPTPDPTPVETLPPIPVIES